MTWSWLRRRLSQVDDEPAVVEGFVARLHQLDKIVLTVEGVIGDKSAPRWRGQVSSFV